MKIPDIFKSLTKTNPGKTVTTDSLNQKEIIAFYNLENFFDTKDDKGKNDSEYLPDSEKHWTQERYKRKKEHIAEVISSLKTGKLPLLTGLAEVENKDVLNYLIDDDLFRDRLDYIHFESGDHRGIDVALLYNKALFTPLISKPLKVEVSSEPHFQTRDILYVKGKLTNGEKLHVFVNHWPSRREGVEKSKHRRVAAAFTIKNEVQEILERNKMAKIVIMGDFNDYPSDTGLAKILKGKRKKSIRQNEFFNLAYKPYSEGKGTHYSYEEWSMFDQILVSYAFIYGDGIITKDDAFSIFTDHMIMFFDKRDNMYKPNRTYRGDHYHGGYSDHLPVFFNIEL
jgi:predicted extracellular nuclease